MKSHDAYSVNSTQVFIFVMQKLEHSFQLNEKMMRKSDRVVIIGRL